MTPLQQKEMIRELIRSVVKKAQDQNRDVELSALYLMAWESCATGKLLVDRILTLYEARGHIKIEDGFIKPVVEVQDERDEK